LVSESNTYKQNICRGDGDELTQRIRDMTGKVC